MALTKTDIAKKVQNELEIPQSLSFELVELLLQIVKDTLSSGEDVLISGFGKFKVKEKRDRRGRNPATGEDLMLEPRRVVKFKYSGKLRDKINR